MMILAWTIFIYWAARGTDLLVGLMFFLPRLKPASTETATYPSLSVIFAARNEGVRTRETVRTLLSQDYPDFEVIAVDDRSDDDTAAQMAEGAHAVSPEKAARLKILKINELPVGWLGKTHALHQGYLAARGEWLLFTDADVVFEAGALRAAMAAAQNRRLDHLTLYPDLVIEKVVEAVFTNYFTLQFNLRYRPWMARFRRTLAYVGIGAFNLVRRDVYEIAGTHKRLALDVADDMMLGKAVKRGGFRQMGMPAGGFVRVRWVEGFAGSLNSLQKNGFRGLEYSFTLLLAATVILLLMDALPFAMIFLAAGTAFTLSLASVAIIFAVYAAASRYSRLTVASFPAHPVATLFFLFILWRSALTTLFEGGIRWRGTFYSLKELKKSRV